MNTIDRNYCPDCRAFLPSSPHKPMCELRQPEPTKGPVKHNDIIDTSYWSAASRVAIMIEEALHRGRKIQAVVITAAVTAHDNRFYGSIFWTEGQ